MKPFAVRRAILISGGMSASQNHARYWNDLLLAYHCLADAGFADSKVEIIYAQGGYQRLSKSISKMTQHATKANVKTALRAALKDAATGDDLLVVVTTNHGDSNSTLHPGHLLQLWRGEVLTYRDLESELSAAACCVLGVFGHCFGADMLGAVTSGGVAGSRAAVAASSGASYAMEPDWSYDEFLYHFFSALRDQSPAGYDLKGEADVNHDSYVDVKEAFDFAKKYDRTADKPAFDDNQLGTFISKLTLEGIL